MEPDMFGQILILIFVWIKAFVSIQFQCGNLERHSDSERLIWEFYFFLNLFVGACERIDGNFFIS